MKVKKLIVVCVLSFVMSFSLGISVSAYNYMCKGLKTIPADIYISTNFSSTQRARIQNAMSTWNTTCFSYDCLEYAGTASISAYPNKDGKNNISILSTTEGYLGQITVVDKKSSFLWLNYYTVEFDININPSYSWYSGTSTTAIGSTQYDLQSTALHELGHALGLAHADDEYYNGKRVVMYYALPKQTIVRTLSEDDRLGIVNLY